MAIEIENEVLQRDKIYIPKLYKVILHNDEVTTMDFVTEILTTIFDKKYDDAVSTMLEIHTKGSAVCGIYTKEIALTKQNSVLNAAKTTNFPLKCTLEQE